MRSALTGRPDSSLGGQGRQRCPDASRATEATARHRLRRGKPFVSVAAELGNCGVHQVGAHVGPPSGAAERTGRLAVQRAGMQGLPGRVGS